jgi:type II secretory pathway component PulF
VAVLDGVSASLQYLVTLILVLAGISAIYQVFVYPQLADLYRSFGASEQPIVHTLFGRTPLVWLMIVVMLAAVWGVWWLFRKIGRSMSQGQALPGRWASWPLIGRVVSEQRSVLAQLWVLVMIDGGARLADAGERASERYGPWSVDSRLSGCEALGTIRAELLARVDAQNERLVAVFVRTRKIVVHVLRALVYILIAMVVTGMYGPIFSLGALT